MRVLYLLVGFFLGVIWLVSSATLLNQQLYEAWHMYTIKAKVMAYYEGHSKGMIDSERRTRDNYFNCFEELDQLRMILKQGRKK